MLKIPKNKRKYIKWIKDQYPIGSLIWDDCRSEPFKVRKDSVFEVFLDDPISGDHEEVQFLIRHPGKNTDRFPIKCVKIKRIN